MKMINYKLYDVIRYPIITEKSTNLSENDQVEFSVNKNCNKLQVKDAVELIYNVKVKSVNTLTVKGKQKKFRGKLGVREDVKKAIVTLQKGQKIEIASGI